MSKSQLGQNTPHKPNEPAGSYTREQRLLQGIHKGLQETPLTDLSRALGRAQSLPMMIQRHGPAQTLLFLESKTNSAEDQQLAKIFRAALQHAEPPLAESLPSKDRRDLSGYMRLDLTRRLHLTACCLELGNLLMRTLKVQNVYA